MSETPLLNSNDSAFLMQRAAEFLYEEHCVRVSPSVVFRPRLSIDGDQWCALYGENLQDGVAGFGSSPEKAMQDFDDAWTRDIGAPPESKTP